MYNKKEIRKIIAKYRLYLFIAIILYILGATPGFLQIYGIKPCFVVPFCIAVALSEENFATMLVYLFSGLLLDASAGKILGFYTLPLLILSIGCMIGVKYVFTPDIKSSFWFSFLTMFVMKNIDFIFNYLVYGYNGLLLFYVKQVFIYSLYSAIFAIPLYLLINKILEWRLLIVDTRWKA